MTPSDLSTLDVSRETRERLENFAALVQKWSPRINLIAANDLTDIWSRHITDAAQIFDLAPESKRWVDMGSGGGFPGVVSAIIAQEKMPNCAFYLIESDQRKAVFLRTASRETGCPINVVADRLEIIEPLLADVLSARALAPLPQLLYYHARHAAEAAFGLYQKGKSWQKEVTEAQKLWHFEFEAVESTTQPGAAVLKIQGVTRV